MTGPETATATAMATRATTPMSMLRSRDIETAAMSSGAAMSAQYGRSMPPVVATSPAIQTMLATTRPAAVALDQRPLADHPLAEHRQRRQTDGAHDTDGQPEADDGHRVVGTGALVEQHRGTGGHQGHREGDRATRR